jgi:hypothetical protein
MATKAQIREFGTAGRKYNVGADALCDDYYHCDQRHAGPIVHEAIATDPRELPCQRKDAYRLGYAEEGYFDHALARPEHSDEGKAQYAGESRYQGCPEDPDTGVHPFHWYDQPVPDGVLPQRPAYENGEHGHENVEGQRGVEPTTEVIFDFICRLALATAQSNRVKADHCYGQATIENGEHEYDAAYDTKEAKIGFAEGLQRPTSAEETNYERYKRLAVIGQSVENDSVLLGHESCLLD